MIAQIYTGCVAWTEMGGGGSRRAEALALAEELLGEIELSTLAPAAMIRKASRLARLLDDSEAMDLALL